jgi:phosphoribosylglycinamide formyltransferase-1|tara:strand:- start:3919 stop:4566 length:648 start_codon:yes stop_codon:yes gene_type:complete
MKKIVVLISGNGSNLQAIIDHCESGNINGEITCVVSNKDDAYGIQRAEASNIKTEIINEDKFESRKDFNEELFNLLLNLNADLIVLAGFMKILNEKTANYFFGKIINIHPSLLPKYPGLNTHTKVIDNKEKYHGVSIHYVSSQLDAGPLIAQGQIIVNKDESVERLEERIHKVEHMIYPEVIKLICDNKIYLDLGRTVNLINEGSKDPIYKSYEI